jgi:hypothetical protein
MIGEPSECRRHCVRPADADIQESKSSRTVSGRFETLAGWFVYSQDDGSRQDAFLLIDDATAQ